MAEHGSVLLTGLKLLSQLDPGLKTESSYIFSLFYRKIGPRNTEREAKLVVFVMETEKALYFKKLNEAISYVFFSFSS